MLPTKTDSKDELISINHDLSILDDQYSVDYFNYVIRTKQSEADQVVSKLKSILFNLGVVDEFKNEMKTETQYVVEMGADLKNAIENGVIKFDKNKAGEIYAQIRTTYGKYGKKLSIKKQLSNKGVNIMELNNALQIKAIEQQMIDMMKVLGDIGEEVSEIIHGQQNDRLGLYFSGLNLYLESKNMQDEGFQKLIVSQALKSLSDSNAQMIQNIQTNVHYLVEKRYKQKKGNSVSEIQDRMIDINKCFETIFRSTIMKASIYYERNEISAMLTTMDEYGKFLSKVIIPNAQKLTEYDVNDTYLENGVWERRAQSFIEMDKLKYQLTNKIEFGIEMKEQENA